MPSKRSLRTVVALTFLATCLSLVVSGESAAIPPRDEKPASPGLNAKEPWVKGEIIIQLHEGPAAQARSRFDDRARVMGARTGIASLDDLTSRSGVREMRGLLTAPGSSRARGRRSPVQDFFVLSLPPGLAERDAIERYRKDPAVKSAQLNYVYEPDLVPNDTQYASQYSHQRTSAEGGWDIETGEVTPKIVIGIIGTGVQLNHPDLAANIVAGWDFAGNDNNPSPVSDGHETSVSGVAAAASNNSLGVAGVCWGCGIMPLRIDYTTAQATAAVDFAVTNGARVINMSFGSYTSSKYGPDSALEAAVQDAVANQVVVVATAGNDQINWRRYPGSLEEVINVASTDILDARSTFSNYGSAVDVAAPGTSVRSTLWNTSGNPANDYGDVSGTSFSAPYVAGLAGLILSKDPLLTVEEVRRRIEYSVDKITTDKFVGSGRVNVQRAVALNAQPVLFAVIKSPLTNELRTPGFISVEGTSLGDSYTLEYKISTSGTWIPIGSGTEVVNGVLGSLDATALAAGFYDVRLTAVDGASQDQSQVQFELTDAIHIGWPQSANDFIHASPSYADLDGDGQQEILFGTAAGQLQVWRVDGSVFPGFPKQLHTECTHSSPSVGDIDGDGDPEIVLANQCDAYVDAFHHNGDVVAGFPRETAGNWVGGSAVLANLDGDAALEIVVVNHNGKVNVWNGSGTPTSLPGWPVTLSGTNAQSTPAIGDVTGDGVPEIVVREYQNVYVFQTSGQSVSGWPKSVLNGGTSPALGDLDSDGIAEIVIVSYQGVGNGYYVTAYEGVGGATIFQTLLPTIQAGPAGIALGDVNDDGDLEIFVPGGSGLVYGLSSQGTLFSSPWPVSAGAAIQGSPLVVDLDGDGLQEVAVASEDNLIHVWNGDGSVSFATHSLGNAVWTTPAAGDLDDDGDVELLAGTNVGDIFVFDLDVPWDPTRADWPTFQGDARHTGLSDRDADGDGDRNPSDCAFRNAARYHGAFEVCDGQDNDCDNIVPSGEQDGDSDTYRICANDCNDAVASIHPGATESCNLIDDNCNGFVDENPAFDQDSDGWTTCEGDCNDQDPRINGTEQSTAGWPDISCWDGLDNDCDGTVDWDCALTVGDEDLNQGQRSPSSGFTQVHPGSADNTYVTYTEKSPGKKLVAYWTLYVPSGLTSTWFDLLVEAHRSPSNGNDTFNLAWARRNQSGECTATSGETYTAAFSVTRTSDPSGSPQLQYLQLGPPLPDTQAFCIRALDTVTSGDNNPTDSLNLDRLYLMPTLLHVRAVSEFTTTGNVINGTSYLQTQNPDASKEQIRESAAPGDALNHTWRFNVPSGSAHNLHIEASRTSGDVGDNMQFYYATPSAGDPNVPGTFSPISGALVDVAVGGINADFPFGTAELKGAVWIRVIDTVSPGSSQQRLDVDYLAIKTTP